MHPSLMATVAQRWQQRMSPANRPWKDGMSPPGAPPSKHPLVRDEAPNAPNVSTRPSPGTVPPRKRGYRPEMNLNGPVV
jgi:hypothetical protein